MAEGDTLVRIATVLRESLAGRQVTAARSQRAAQVARLVGDRVESVEARGKHLLIHFGAGVTLHTHLGLHGSWHRYRPAETWRRAPGRASIVLETASVVCVCFDARTVELVETRAIAIHPALRQLGPDASAEDFDIDEAHRRLTAAANAEREIGDALLDQRIVAGLGNVYRSELPFLERIDPRTPVGALDDATLRRLLEHGQRLLRANAAGGRRVTTTPGSGGDLYVYGRAGRPCRRCDAKVSSAAAGEGRRLYWCPGCQSAAG